MSEHLPVPLDAVPLKVKLPFALYVKVGGYFVKFREAGDEVTPERTAKLKDNVDFLFIKKASWENFVQYLETICDVEVKEPEQAADNIHHLLLTYGRHLEEMKRLDSETVNKLRRLSIRLVEMITLFPSIQSRLLRRYEETSVYYSNHSVNVAVYAIVIGRQIGLSKPDLSLLAFGCLVHNIGNTQVPEPLLYKSGKYSEEEWATVQSHTELGAEILEALGAPREVVMTAQQHHERMDGAGYPRRMKGNDIHLFAKICSIADVYDALTSHRPSFLKPPLTPQEAVVEMASMKGKFDPAILPILGNA